MPHLPVLDRTVLLHHEALQIVGETLAKKTEESGAITPGTFNCIQVQAFEFARWLAEASAAESLIHYAEKEGMGEFERRLTTLYTSRAVTNVAKHLLHEYHNYGLASLDRLEEFLSIAAHLRIHTTPECWTQLGQMVLERDADFSGLDGLDETHVGFKSMFARFSDSVIAPLAEKTHREDRIIPDNVLKQLSDLGVFGISIPQEYGGSFYDHLVMVSATEELSRGSLGAGGSVLTRPEICAKAILSGGTDDQKKRWLPQIASGEKMVCIAVTEPNTGSDVASVSLSATKVEGGYVLNGEKTWATFAGRSEIICLLARTGSRESGRRGLSLFIVEKPYDPNNDEHHFRHEQKAGGVIEGRSIPTIGYRGMHSFSIAFENYFVPEENRIGDEGRGFYLQMQGFAGGRIQTAARALGVMEASFRAAVNYTKSRKLFGHQLADFNLTKFKLGQMAARIQANRQLVFHVASLMDSGEGTTEASLVKLLACRDAEWVTREAMQLHGGMGYSEEYPVSRYYLDARVLSIFEGAEEVLALHVIARPFLEKFLQPVEV